MGRHVKSKEASMEGDECVKGEMQGEGRRGSKGCSREPQKACAKMSAWSTIRSTKY